MTFFSDIWKSFLDMPLWVRVWTFLILVPINFSAVLFIEEPGAFLVASLAVAGVAFNAIPLWIERGFSNTMAISHVVLWIPLVIIIIIDLANSELVLRDNYRYFLMSLLLINLISLAFDIPDVFKWIKDRKRNTQK